LIIKKVMWPEITAPRLPLREYNSFDGKQKSSQPQKISHRQHGVSLFIVLVILLLSLIIVMGGLAVTNLNESIVGNQSDAQRAYGAAEALLDAAQSDIRLNGRYCNAVNWGDSGENTAVLTGTPAEPTTCFKRYPSNDPDEKDYEKILVDSTIIGAIDTCSSNPKFIGVCISSSPASSKFMIDTVNNGDISKGAEQLSNGANYGNSFISVLDNNTQWGGSANVGGINSANSVSLALGAGNIKEAKGAKGSYWVEIFRYQDTNLVISPGVQNNIPVPDDTYPFVFRITALATGLKSNTVSVLRTYYIPYPAIDASLNGNSSADSTSGSDNNTSSTP
jgi:type IV pilus assembly protein PilX